LDTELVREFLERFAAESAEEIAGWIGVSAQTVRLWRQKLMEGGSIGLREVAVRKAIQRRLKGIAAESTAWAEGYLEAIRRMRLCLDNIEEEILPPGGGPTRLD
jgi:transposase-like protein